VGFQAQAPALREDAALRVASAVEAATGTAHELPGAFA
jgi:hypothetical protein